MPVWGEILTPEQLDSLSKHTYDTSKGTGIAAGARLFADNCSGCHGQFGEGGPNPARANDVIPPISTAEYLKTRDDATLRSITAQGQPNLGMSSFGAAYGGPLSDEQISAIVAFIRGWEANPPVELPPEISSNPTPANPPVLNGPQVFSATCARCHGANGEGGIGPAFNKQAFQGRYDDQELFDIINNGHEATAMIAWGEILTNDQIQQLVKYIRSIKSVQDGTAAVTSTPAASIPTMTPGAISFSADVLPIFQDKCQVCHSKSTKLGGWNSSTYEAVMTSGDNSPVIITGDTANNILVQRILGKLGNQMPPSGKLSDQEIQIILDWITSGALDN